MIWVQRPFGDDGSHHKDAKLVELNEVLHARVPSHHSRVKLDVVDVSFSTALVVHAPDPLARQHRQLPRFRDDRIEVGYCTPLNNAGFHIVDRVCVARLGGVFHVYILVDRIQLRLFQKLSHLAALKRLDERALLGGALVQLGLTCGHGTLEQQEAWGETARLS